MSDFHTYVEELFADLGPVKVKRMFGGAGIYAGDVMFGLISEDQIYLRADAALSAELQAEGSVRWVYEKRATTKTGKSVDMPYWRLPESALDEPDEAARWGRRAVAAAAQAKAAKPKKKAL